MFKNFDELISKVKNNTSPKVVAVVGAEDSHTIEAVELARRDGLVTPIYIGNQKGIINIFNSLVIPHGDNIYHVESDTEAAQVGCRLVRKGAAHFLMKGLIQTKDLLKVVVDKELGLRTDSIMSHVCINEIPTYHKLIAVTDGGMNLYPTLEEKRKILENCVEAFLNMGYSNPKVAVLAAVEVVNPKMEESVHGDALKGMNLSGEIKNCVVEGPISYDLAMSSETAITKGYTSSVSGDADILLVPNITVGNVLGKALTYSAGGRMAGFIVGAAVPIVLTSRGATTEEKYLSLVLSASAVK